MAEKTVAIIGAGISGLVAAQQALAYKLTPTIFEKSDKVGGLWRKGLWRNFRSDLVKFNMSFSCKKWAKELGIFPKKDQVLNYIEEFAEENDLLRYTEFGSTVEGCEQGPDFRWTLTVVREGVRSERGFDFLVIANGFNNFPKMPTIPGLDTFPGRVMHSMHYNFVEHFKETYSKILIVGGNFSGTEIAADIVTHSDAIVKHVICSGHKKAESMSALTAHTFISPIDLIRYSAYNQFVNESDDSWEREDFSKAMSANVLTHEQGNEFLTIKKAKESAFRTVNKDYISHTASGQIKVFKSPIIKISGRQIFLVDGQTLEADLIIFATGYLTDLPFLSERHRQLLGYSQSDQATPLLLYYDIYNPNVPNLGFVGFTKGIFFPMIELQARYLASVFAGKAKLPPVEVMQNFIEKKKDLRILRAKLPVLPLENLHQTVDFATVIQASPLTEELRKTYPLVYDCFTSKPFNSCMFNFIGKHASPVRAFGTFVEMLGAYNDRLTPQETREFVSWIASLDRNFDLLTNLFTGTFAFERVVQDFRRKSNLVIKGTAGFAAEEDNARMYHETASQKTDADVYFEEFHIGFDSKASRLRFQLKDLAFTLNFKKNPLFASDKVEAGDTFACLDISVNSIGKFTLTLLVKTDEVDQRISTKYKLRDIDS